VEDWVKTDVGNFALGVPWATLQCIGSVCSFFFFYNPEYLEIALGGKRKHVPYGALKDNSRVLVEERYQPQGTTLQDPRNMSKDDLIAVLDHIHNWQVTFSLGDAFRFSHFRSKNGRLHKLRYPTADGNLTACRTKKETPC